MKKNARRILICFLVAALSWSVFLISDRKELNDGLIRFHVVAHSDRNEDQLIKLSVRDAILQEIQSDMLRIADIEAAKEYLQDNIPKLQRIVDQTLDELGFSGGASISLCKEQFDIRYYDTFRLPAGVYNALRIVIGDGQGRNWWCVSFPVFCLPATTSAFADAAASAGFSEPLVQTLVGNEAYEIRFFFLNQLGKLDNILFKG